jgi:peptide methionine sulfoxide reductase MsrA
MQTQIATFAAGCFWGVERALKRQIVTEIVPAERFWAAEDYHQQHLEKRGQASCAISLDAA